MTHCYVSWHTLYIPAKNVDLQPFKDAASDVIAAKRVYDSLFKKGHEHINDTWYMKVEENTIGQKLSSGTWRALVRTSDHIASVAQ